MLYLCMLSSLFESERLLRVEFELFESFLRRLGGEISSRPARQQLVVVDKVAVTRHEIDHRRELVFGVETSLPRLAIRKTETNSGHLFLYEIIIFKIKHELFLKEGI